MTTYSFSSMKVGLHRILDSLLAISVGVQVDSGIIDDRVDPIGMRLLYFRGQGLD
jgi:hypothetical protein